MYPGFFDKLVEEAIAGYDKIIGLDLSEVAVDGSLRPPRVVIRKPLRFMPR
jgi:hypothetical protein